VARAEPLGRSGETGLAGGDHLHFAVLIHGVYATPLEWWDEHWIRDRIAKPLGEAGVTVAGLTEGSSAPAAPSVPAAVRRAPRARRR